MHSVICPHCRGKVDLTRNRIALTRRQREVFEFIREHITAVGYAPTMEEIMARFQYTAISSAHDMVAELRRRGWITTRHQRARSIEIVEDAA